MSHLLFLHEQRMDKLSVDDAGPERASRDGRDEPQKHQDFQLVVEWEPKKGIKIKFLGMNLSRRESS